MNEIGTVIGTIIPSALAAHGVVGTGSSGGGRALLIILGVVIVLAAAHVGLKRWRRRRPLDDRADDSPEQ